MNTLARIAYQVAMACAAPLLLGYLWWRGRADRQYRLRWGERLGWVARAHTGAVLVHCGSLGEVLAARPLVESLLADPRWGRPLLTCTTPTGSRQVRKEFGDRVDHVYFPLDMAGAVRRFLARRQPRLVILLERELWPNFLFQAQAQGIAVVVANARLSAPSAALYRRWRALMQPALQGLRLVCCEDAATAGRFAALGVDAQRIRVCGNIKSDLRLPAGLPAAVAATRQAIGPRKVLTAGSTHVGEDEALIDAWRQHLARHPTDLLVLVPRHPERFEAVARLLQQAGLRFVRHSQGQRPHEDTQVLLGDTMGELLHWYGVADACLVGGSLVARGGHNPLEVLALDKPLLAGPHTHNFAQLYDALAAAGAMQRVATAEAAFTQFASLLHNPEATQRQIANGRRACQAMTGAVARTMAALEPFARHQHSGSAVLAARQGTHTVWVDSRHFEAAEPCLFDAAWWQRHGSSETLGGGRSHVHRVGDGRGQYLLRHYYRGGMVARISRDLFLRGALGHSRAMAEFTLLGQLRARGLAVPEACAAHHVRHGPLYRADILVAWIPQASDLARRLRGGYVLDARQWQVLGAAVRALHDEQVWHSDLNCHNLMLDAADKAWIVDFDKCGFRAGDHWKPRNLERLLRSLRKEARLDPCFGWHEDHWQHLLHGYHGLPTQGADGRPPINPSGDTHGQ